MTSKPKRIFLSPPHLTGREMDYLGEALESNYIAPIGPMLTAFARELSDYLDIAHVCLVSSGTAALHLGMRIGGVDRGHQVWASTLTFIGGVTPILFQGAEPVFFDVREDHWNLDLDLLEAELAVASRRGRLPKAIITTDLYGQPTDLDRVRELCAPYEVLVVADAAESIGATIHGRKTGKGADLAVFSFNGNKIITTSGGGAIATDNKDWARMAQFLATQAREPAPHYEHVTFGYNYAMSNILAAIGRAQLTKLDERIALRRRLFDGYVQRLVDLPGITFMPEAPYCRGNRWLTVILVDEAVFGASSADIRTALEDENIEARPVWKPMHLQRLFAGCHRVRGEIAEKIFAQGLCLPSGTQLNDDDLDRIANVIQNVPTSKRSALKWKRVEWPLFGS
jgi:dTDP-4-amino-4,6-dideoxygalactose transaminase